MQAKLVFLCFLCVCGDGEFINSCTIIFLGTRYSLTWCTPPIYMPNSNMFQSLYLVVLHFAFHLVSMFGKSVRIIAYKAYKTKRKRSISPLVSNVANIDNNGSF